MNMIDLEPTLRRDDFSQDSHHPLRAVRLMRAPDGEPDTPELTSKDRSKRPKTLGRNDGGMANVRRKVEVGSGATNAAAAASYEYLRGTSGRKLPKRGGTGRV